MITMPNCMSSPYHSIFVSMAIIDKMCTYFPIYLYMLKRKTLCLRNENSTVDNRLFDLELSLYHNYNTLAIKWNLNSILFSCYSSLLPSSSPAIYYTLFLFVVLSLSVGFSFASSETNVLHQIFMYRQIKWIRKKRNKKKTHTHTWCIHTTRWQLFQ